MKCLKKVLTRSIIKNKRNIKNIRNITKKVIKMKPLSKRVIHKKMKILIKMNLLIANKANLYWQRMSKMLKYQKKMKKNMDQYKQLMIPNLMQIQPKMLLQPQLKKMNQMLLRMQLSFNKQLKLMTRIKHKMLPLLPFKRNQDHQHQRPY